MASDKTTQFVSRKRSSSKAANFVAFLTGMVTSLTLLMMIWNHFLTPSKIDRVLANTTKTKSTTEPGLKLSSKDFDTVLHSGTAEQLTELLETLKQKANKGGSLVRISENRKCLRVTSRLLQLPLSPTLRNEVIKVKFEAMSAIYGLDLLNELNLPAVGADLQALANQYVNDSNEEISRVAQLTLAKVESYEFIKGAKAGATQDIKRVPNRIEKLLHEYPNDSVVLSTVKLIVLSLVNFDRQAGIEIMREIAAKADDFQSPLTVEFLRSLNDDIVLLESEYHKKFENRYVDGAAGQQEILNTLLALASNPQGRKNLLNTIDEGANWFEQINHFDQAKLVYQTLIESASRRSDAKFAEMAGRLGSDGISRCNLIRQPLEYNGFLLDNLTFQETLKPAEVKDRVAVIIFWSLHDTDSLNALNEFQSVAQLLKHRLAVVIAVCMDEQLDETHVKVACKFRSIRFVGYPDGKPVDRSLLQQCPVSRLPFAMTVDHKGLVHDVNVPMDELKAAVDYLLIRQLEDR